MATGPCQQSVQRLDERTGWIAQELMGMKKALESERRAMASGCVVASEYWQTPFGEGNEQGSWRTTSRQSGFEAATQSRVLGEVLEQARAHTDNDRQGGSGFCRGRPSWRTSR